MHYVISDIHGCYTQFAELLNLIRFKDTDILYVLGDIVDRGPHPIKVLSALMELPNFICTYGIAKCCLYRRQPRAYGVRRA